MTIRTQILQLTQDDQAMATLLEQLNAQTPQDPKIKQALATAIDRLLLQLGDEIGAKKQALKQYVTLEFINLAVQQPAEDLSFTLTSQDCGLDLKQLAARIEFYNQLAKLDGSAKIDTIAETLAREELAVTPINDNLTISLKR